MLYVTNIQILKDNELKGASCLKAFEASNHKISLIYPFVMLLYAKIHYNQSFHALNGYRSVSYITHLTISWHFFRK